MGILKKVRNFFSKKQRFDTKNEKINSNALSKFLHQDKYLSKKDVNTFLSDFKGNSEELTLQIKEHNEEYLKLHLEKDKKYLNSIFEKVDPVIQLDEEQRQVVLNDEDYTLVIAGAGAGKSTTVVAKVKYLVDIKKVDPKEILVISYTNKAVNELRKRIHEEFKIKCPITTFHSTGYAIIRKDNFEKTRIVTEEYLDKCLREYLTTKLLKDEKLLYKTLLFFSYYIDLNIDVENIEDVKKIKEFNVYQPLAQQLESYNQKIIDLQAKQRNTIRYERLKSAEEVKIANFLYLNGIDYEYEKPYPHFIPGMKRPYLPDFTIIVHNEPIYIEHFGITEDGKNSYYDAQTLDKYIKAIEWKKRLHKKHHTKLVYTYSSYNDGRNFLEDLKSQLENLQIEFKPRDAKEVFQQLTKNQDSKCYRRLLKLLSNFIESFKTNGWDVHEFERLEQKTKDERNKVFLEIAQSAYVYYQTKLEEEGKKDFSDLINDSTKILEDSTIIKDKLSFKYIIIDEYQDISLQRFNLAKKLSEITNAKIIAVGDDWQSIYSFAGSRLKLFTEFEKSMGYAQILRITHTYRNSQELIDIAGNFIQKNDEQYKKNLISPKHLEYPVVIFSYSDDSALNKAEGKGGMLVEKAKAIEKALDAIVKTNKKENLSILLIGRFGFDGYNLSQTPLFEYVKDYENNKNRIISKKYPKLDIEFMTAHSSKGVGKDEVILINCSSGTWGFPCDKKYDPLLNMVIYNDITYEDAEERRLFYVALTRTKNRVYIIAPQYNPSRFLLEIQNEANVYKDYEFSSEHTKKRLGNYCPCCGFPLYYVPSLHFNKSMYVCSNDSEVCGFITNNIKGGRTSIKKCPKCEDGYLFVKKKVNQEHYFLGCTNYKKDNTGCSYAEELDREL